ncbi:BON domain-containing protein [Variovorax paradoxus]|nr:BON domain-containing protein [Variovorax paradoxus]
MIQLDSTFKRSPRWMAAALLAGGALALTGCGDRGTNTADSTATPPATQPSGAARDTGAAVSARIDDATITAAVSAGLAKDPDLSAIKIDVDTKGGTVMLKGPAPTAAAKSRAEQIAKNVKGVSSVDNQLEVKSM